MMDINQIVEGCKSGDRKSQRKLFEMLYGKMIVVIKRYIKDESLAQDILSDSFIKIFESIKTYEFKGSFEGWARRIVVNTTIDYIRKNKKLFFLEPVSDNNMEPEAKSVFDSVDISPEECLTLIHGLSPAYRTIFNMRVFEEMTHKDIAESLGIKENTSKANYSKARVVLNNRVIDFMNNKKAEEDAKKELCRIIDIEKRK
jgi:RNA polymerase sigma-70 factor (ECF subfamily)